MGYKIILTLLKPQLWLSLLIGLTLVSMIVWMKTEDKLSLNYVILLGVLVNFILGCALLWSKKRKVNKYRYDLHILHGAKGRTLGAINIKGRAVIRGDVWQVHTQRPIEADKSVEVIHVEGLRLLVREIE